MYSLNQLATLFQSEIESYTLPETPQNLYRPIEYALESGGKRIRPLLVYIAANMFSDKIDSFTPAAMAIEIFHNFTLLHDDIMDNADVRRGRASVHKKWNSNIALLSGDVMVIKAYDSLSKCKIDNFHQVFNSFNTLATLVCEGQQYDMDFEEQNDVSIAEYINMITLKTSALIAGALKIGAQCANASEQDSELLYQVGLNLGNAFQLQDDLLDVYGDPKTFGKRIGGDIVEGKKTYLLLSLLKMASNSDREMINLLLANSSMNEESKIDAFKKLYAKYRIKEFTQNVVDDYYEKAIELIEKIDVLSERKVSLHELAAKLIKREV